jgi:hypothetical protein
MIVLKRSCGVMQLLACYTLLLVHWKKLYKLLLLFCHPYPSVARPCWQETVSETGSAAVPSARDSHRSGRCTNPLGQHRCAFAATLAGAARNDHGSLRVGDLCRDKDGHN